MERGRGRRPHATGGTASTPVLMQEQRINFLFATLGRHFVEREHTVELSKAIRIEVGLWPLLRKPVPMRIFSTQQHRTGSGKIGFPHVRSHKMDRESDTAVVCEIRVRRMKRISSAVHQSPSRLFRRLYETLRHNP